MAPDDRLGFLVISFARNWMHWRARSRLRLLDHKSAFPEDVPEWWSLLAPPGRA